MKEYFRFTSIPVRHAHRGVIVAAYGGQVLYRCGVLEVSAHSAASDAEALFDQLAARFQSRAKPFRWEEDIFAYFTLIESGLVPGTPTVARAGDNTSTTAHEGV